MEQLVNALSAWMTAFFDALASLVGGAIRLFETPAQMIGVPAELFAAALFLGVMIVLWRAMNKYIM